MNMHNPPHPGEFIRQIYLDPFPLTGRQLAMKLDVSSSTIARLLSGKTNISPEMALRLSKALGRSPESWLAMQHHYDLWMANKNLDLSRVGRVHFDAA